MVMTRGVFVAAEEVRAQLRHRLAEEYGMDQADMLLDRPPGGWDDLVTKDWLHLELGALEARMGAKFAAIEAQISVADERLGTVDTRLDRVESRLDDIARELRSQTWRLVAVLVAGMGIAIGAGRF
jgi:hypothetical protein